jgi:hypothetical protein
MTIVPATRELLERFYGEAPARTQKAVVAIDGERVVGVAGLYVDDERQVMFADLTDEVRHDKRTVIKGIREVMKLASHRMPVHSLADPEIEGSDTLLLHMGFTPLEGRVYQWHK